MKIIFYILTFINIIAIKGLYNLYTNNLPIKHESFFLSSRCCSVDYVNFFSRNKDNTTNLGIDTDFKLMLRNNTLK